MTSPLQCPQCLEFFLQGRSASGHGAFCPHCAYHDSLEAFDSRACAPSVAVAAAPEVPAVAVMEAASAVLEFECRHCDAIVQAPADYAGMTAPCPYCSLPIQAPSKEELAAEAAAREALAKVPYRGTTARAKYLMLSVCGSLAVLLFAASWIWQPAASTGLPGNWTRESLQMFLATTLAADSWEDLLPHLRDAAEIEPRMASYYAASPYKPFTNLQVGATATQSIGDSEFLLVDVETSAGKERLALEQVGDQLKLDWPSLVDYAALQWRNFLNHPADGMTVPLACTVRWGAVPDEVVRQAPFPDQESLIFFQLEFNAENPGTMYACAAQGSPAAEKLMPVLNSGQARQARLAVSLHPMVATSAQKIVFVHDYLQDGWVEVKD